MQQVVVERFDARPQALHSRLNAQAGKRRGRSIQWIALRGAAPWQKDESFPPDHLQDRLG
jgi:hypothetical protein